MPEETLQEDPNVSKRKFKKVEKGMVSFEHDAFDLLPAIFLKNESYKAFQPVIRQKLHRHKFHSVNDKTGQPNEFCSPAVGGHFHMVKVDFTKTVTTKVTHKNGKTEMVEGPLVEVGPPLHTVITQTKSGKNVKRIKRVIYEVDDDDREEGAEDGYDRKHKGPIEDNHTHETVYMGTDVIMFGTRNKMRDEERQKVAGAMSGPVSSQFRNSQKIQNNAADGKKLAAGQELDA